MRIHTFMTSIWRGREGKGGEERICKNDGKVWTVVDGAGRGVVTPTLNCGHPPFFTCHLLKDFLCMLLLHHVCFLA